MVTAAPVYLASFVVHKFVQAMNSCRRYSKNFKKFGFGFNQLNLVVEAASVEVRHATKAVADIAQNCDNNKSRHLTITVNQTEFFTKL